MTVLGGVGYVSGSVFGAQFWPGAIGSELGHLFGISNLNQWLVLITGVVLVLLLKQDPNGMASHTVGTLRRHAVDSDERRRPSPLVPPASALQRVTPKSLVVDRVSVAFGGVRALADVGVTVAPGQGRRCDRAERFRQDHSDRRHHGVRPTQRGVDHSRRSRAEHVPAFERNRAGLSRSFQSLELFDDVSVLENLRAASDTKSRASYLTSIVAPTEPPLPASAWNAITEFRLADVLGQRPSELSYGTRRLLAIARAISSSPSILLLDEPASGLSQTEAAELAVVVRRLADDWGVGVLVVEHNMAFMMGLCDHIVVLNFGKVIDSGPPERISSSEAVVSAYLGAAS